MGSNTYATGGERVIVLGHDGAEEGEDNGSDLHLVCWEWYVVWFWSQTCRCVTEILCLRKRLVYREGEREREVDALKLKALG